MKTRKPRKPHPRANDLPPCVIIWDDASREDTYDGPLSGIPDLTVRNHTIGYLASPPPSKHARREAKLVSEISPEENTVRWPLGVPPGMIRAILLGVGVVRYVIERGDLPAALKAKLIAVLDEGEVDAKHVQD